MDPGERASAITEAAAANDRSAIPRLIALLDSDDPGTRLLAIEALHRLTGETFGYDYTVSEALRRESIGRWVKWQADQSRSVGSS